MPIERGKTAEFRKTKNTSCFFYLKNRRKKLQVMECLQGREEYCEDEKHLFGEVSNHPFSFPSSSTSPPQYKGLPPRPNERLGEPVRSNDLDLCNMNLVVMNSGGTVREHMFDKVVTPSDVGKLNRLVVPKQHAEKYFPLDSSIEKGLILNFEDSGGKPWMFRYSYWNSSQSYVITKGWSRFVKDKKLNAGDTITFYRAKDRLYIDWKRRCDAPDPSPLVSLPLLDPSSHRPVPWGPQFIDHLHQSYSGPCEYNNAVKQCSVFYLSEEVGVMQHGGDQIIDSMPVVHSKASAKWVRLFGVNLECPVTDGDRDGNAEILSPGAIASVSSHPQLSMHPHNSH